MPVANFSNPPVGEVSFGLSFSPLTAFKVAHYGAFWELIRKDYPDCDDKPQVVDTSGPAIGVGEWFPPPRVWYLHRDRNYLIQLQPNRIWLNWRRINEADEYPRFETLAPIFRDTVRQFADFSRANNIGDVTAIGGELTYVNHIPTGELWKAYSDVGNFMRDVRWTEARETLPSPAGIAWRAEFKIDANRLAVELKTAREQAGAKRPMYLLEIRASTTQGEEFTANSLDWFGKANKLIVEAFCELTTLEAQRGFWKRTDLV